jgi:spermidine synthase
MGGLALGSWLFGTRADRLAPRRTLETYAAVEVGIGVSGLLVPLLLAVSGRLYVGLYPALEKTPALFFVAQALLVALVLLPSTTLMGGTYPLMARALAGAGGRIGPVLSKVYAANTLGAASGIALVLVVLLPSLGQRGSELAALGANLVAAALVFGARGLGTAPAEPAPRGRSEAPADGPEDRSLLAGTLLSGFAAKVGEVVWSRILVLSIGSSVYAFGVVVLLFLAGSAAGSALLARGAADGASARRAFVVAQVVLAAVVLASSFYAPWLGGVFVELFPSDRDAFGLVLVAQLAVGALLCLVPATLFGLSFPAIATAVASAGSVGRSLGKVTVTNTAGTVAGSLLAGFAFVPLLGLRGTLLVLAGVAAVAARVVSPARWALGRRAAEATLAAVLVAAVVGPGWSTKLLASGAGFGAP